MEYSADEATVLYQSKDGKDKKTYDALEWLAAMASNVPERGKQSIRYYGACANSVRGTLRGRQEVERPPHCAGAGERVTEKSKVSLLNYWARSALRRCKDLAVKGTEIRQAEKSKVLATILALQPSVLTEYLIRAG